MSYHLNMIQICVFCISGGIKHFNFVAEHSQLSKDIDFWCQCLIIEKRGMVLRLIQAGIHSLKRLR